MAASLRAPEAAIDRPRLLADRAIAFEAKLHRLLEDLDPEWREQLMLRWPLVNLLPDGAPGQRLFARIFVQRCGGLPALERLLEAPAALVLQDRPAMRNALCLLALACRPGVLRCCVDRRARLALQEALESNFDALMTLSGNGRAMNSVASAWTPLHWSCVGYFDWRRLMKKADDALLRRVVRVSLPRLLLSEVADTRPPCQLKPGPALQRLAATGIAWPC